MPNNPQPKPAKFLSIRLDPESGTQVFVNNTATSKPDMPQLQTFTVEGPYHVVPPGAEAQVEIIPVRWPVIYPSPTLLRLGAQWSTPITEIALNDRTGINDHRSYESVEFTYDKAGKTLSWMQAGNKLAGSVKITNEAPVWYVILRPAGGNGEGFLKVNGATVAQIT